MHSTSTFCGGIAESSLYIVRFGPRCMDYLTYYYLLLLLRCQNGLCNLMRDDVLKCYLILEKEKPR